MPEFNLNVVLGVGLFALTALLLAAASQHSNTSLGRFLALSSFVAVAGAGFFMFRAYMGEKELGFEQAGAGERKASQRRSAQADSEDGSGGGESSSGGDRNGRGASGTGSSDGAAEDGSRGSPGSGLGRPRQAFPATLQQSGSAKGTNVIRDCEQCPEMVIVDAGFYRMGSVPDDDDAEPAEQPGRMVSVPRRFAISRGEVTVGQYMAFAHATGRVVPDCLGVNPGRPAACVSWQDATDYMAWLRTVSGRTYRLPTEIEWEWAARGGSGDRYVTGKEPAFRRINAFGLINVHGGVAEIAAGCWIETLKDMPSDPTRQARGGDCKRRPLRDAAEGEHIALARLSARRPIGVEERRAGVGFRIAREP